MTVDSKDGACIFAFENFQADGSKESWLKHKLLYYDNFPGYESQAPSSHLVGVYPSAEDRGSKIGLHDWTWLEPLYATTGFFKE